MTQENPDNQTRYHLVKLETPRFSATFFGSVWRGICYMTDPLRCGWTQLSCWLYPSEWRELQAERALKELWSNEAYVVVDEDDHEEHINSRGGTHPTEIMPTRSDTIGCLTPVFNALEGGDVYDAIAETVELRDRDHRDQALLCIVRYLVREMKTTDDTEARRKILQRTQAVIELMNPLGTTREEAKSVCQVDT